jgi:hypothetical protein
MNLQKIRRRPANLNHQKKLRNAKVEKPSEEPVSPAEEQSTPSDTAGFEEVSLMRLPLLVLGGH